ncbi:MAG: ankyrin repeat domain-containing protein [Saprospiraceae bacterium]|nr:ankyrin repeat domain-containing protein [Saprospiraceae bacterium]
MPCKKHLIATKIEASTAAKTTFKDILCSKFSHAILTYFGLIFLLFSCGRAVPDTPPTETELVTAVMARQTAVVDSLLSAGAPANSRDEEGTPVLILAVNGGQIASVKSLVKFGADVNAQREAYFVSTALMEATVRNDPGLVRWLLDNGANLHQRDTLGDTPLNWASFYGHEDLVSLFVDRGADWSISSKQGTAVDIALHRGHQHLIQYFINNGAGEEIDLAAKEFLTAVANGDIETVKTSLRAGISPNQKDALGSPALLLAAEYGQEEIVQYLLRAGAEKQATNRVGESAMARAARFGHAGIVNRLLSIKLDPNFAEQPFLLRPLVTAAQAGDVEVIQELLASDADPNIQDGINGFTPLMIATANGNAEAVKAFLAGGASPYIKGFNGEGLYDMLRYSNDPEIGSIIRERLLE